MSRNIRRMWTVLAATAGLFVSITATAQAAVSYQFIHVKTVKCMSVAGGSTANSARIVIATCNRADTAQIWHQENGDANGYYTYRNDKSGKCLAVPGGSLTAGVELIQWTCNSGPEQRWGLNYSDSHYHLENLNSGLAITPLAGGTIENTRLVQQPYASGFDQLWEPN